MSVVSSGQVLLIVVESEDQVPLSVTPMAPRELVSVKLLSALKTLFTETPSMVVFQVPITGFTIEPKKLQPLSINANSIVITIVLFICYSCFKLEKIAAVSVIRRIGCFRIKPSLAIPY